MCVSIPSLVLFAVRCSVTMSYQLGHFLTLVNQSWQIFNECCTSHKFLHKFVEVAEGMRNQVICYRSISYERKLVVLIVVEMRVSISSWHHNDVP